MSTELDIFQQGGAVTSAKRDDGFTNAIGSSSINSKSISIVNNKFRMVVNGKEIMKSDDPHLDVIIVNAAPEVNRIFYSGTYDPKAVKREPPQCWSHDSRVPADDVANKQSDTCEACPQNIKGSGPGTTKACRFHRYIAVVLASDPKGDIYRVKLSATSVFGSGTDTRRPFNEYRDYLVANGEALGSVISRMLVGEDTSNIGFRPVGRLTDEQFAYIKSRSQSEEAKRAITLSVATDKHDEDGAEFSQPTPAPVQTAPAPAPQPAATTPDDDIPEPVKRDAKPAPAKAEPAPAPKVVDAGDVSLDDLVADWT